MIRISLASCVGAALVALSSLETTSAAPYTPVVIPPGAFPAIGPGVIVPKLVFGKEYSRDMDEDSMGVLDPEQIVAWDGIGGTGDGLDYSLSRGVDYPREQQVDATANVHDLLFSQLREDRAHLIFSHDDVVAIPGAAGGPPLVFAPAVPLVGPVGLSNLNSIFGAAEVSVEVSGIFSGAPPEIQLGWAAIGDIQTMAGPKDLDSVEVWGPEPAFKADANKYSLEDDVMAGAGTSVFTYDIPTTTSFPYISHATIVSAVESLLGMAPTSGYNRLDKFGRDAINLDALMVNDNDGEENQFGGLGDAIIFSINQIVDPTDPDGYYATGSELFVLEGTAAGLVPSFLKHGAHAWDHLYTLGALRIVGGGPQQGGIIDINAIEAVGELVKVPEPSSALLLGLAGIVGLARRRQATLLI
ncbi:PEP-CTERM sorting domain-containing protein [Bythopirellula polymerisocia]|uniref:Ice-binding protein C-terminal domain-containing protein n=1 Tax=Bythopirellula polymerisocia TaxID=2528003 RepID=A0A5C6CRS0_9BACT|nr:PEP-CTERM sorting domain-containing protein [Bythopirellula polymerisocia]TWU25816.1 hypothetical protein Pla144_30280 [Bythopirellula polymerisocia]